MEKKSGGWGAEPWPPKCALQIHLQLNNCVLCMSLAVPFLSSRVCCGCGCGCSEPKQQRRGKWRRDVQTRSVAAPRIPLQPLWLFLVPFPHPTRPVRGLQPRQEEKEDSNKEKRGSREAGTTELVGLLVDLGFI